MNSTSDFFYVTGTTHTVNVRTSNFACTLFRSPTMCNIQLVTHTYMKRSSVRIYSNICYYMYSSLFPCKTKQSLLGTQKDYSGNLRTSCLFLSSTSQFVVIKPSGALPCNTGSNLAFSPTHQAVKSSSTPAKLFFLVSSDKIIKVGGT